jgi:hypothetical protein
MEARMGWMDGGIDGWKDGVDRWMERWGGWMDGWWLVGFIDGKMG